MDDPGYVFATLTASVRNPTSKDAKTFIPVDYKGAFGYDTNTGSLFQAAVKRATTGDGGMFGVTGSAPLFPGSISGAIAVGLQQIRFERLVALPSPDPAVAEVPATPATGATSPAKDDDPPQTNNPTKIPGAFPNVLEHDDTHLDVAKLLEAGAELDQDAADPDATPSDVVLDEDEEDDEENQDDSDLEGVLNPTVMQPNSPELLQMKVRILPPGIAVVLYNPTAIGFKLLVRANLVHYDVVFTVRPRMFGETLRMLPQGQRS